MNFVELLKNDVRFQEGLIACMNCGTCTATCPDARFNIGIDVRIGLENDGSLGFKNTTSPDFG